MTAYEFASIVVAALGLVGGVIGFFRSVIAGRRSAEAEAKAADAQADATAALQKSAAAEERIAKALEAIAKHGGVTPRAAAGAAPAAGTGPAPGTGPTPGTEPGNTPGAAATRNDTSGAPDASESLAAALRALLPDPAVQWRVEPRLEAGSYRLRNVGTVTAVDVTVSGARTPGASALLPGQALNVAPGPDGRDIEVQWRDDASAKPRSARLALPRPTTD